MQAVSIVVDYLLWTAPAVFIYAALYRYVKRTGKAKQFGLASTGVAFVPVSITIKQTFLHYFPNLGILNLTKGSLLLIICYGIIIAGILKIKKPQSIPKFAIMYVLYGISVVIFALIKKNLLAATYLSIYLIIILEVIFALETVYSVMMERNPNIRGSFAVFSALLITDFTINAFAGIRNLSGSIRITIASLSIDAVASAVLIYAVLCVLKKPEERITLTEDFRIALNKFLKRLTIAVIIFSISFSLYAFMTIYFLNFTVQADLKNYTQMISLDARETTNNFQFILSKARRDLGKFATDPDIINLNEKGEEKLKDYYIKNKDKFATVSRVNKDGVIIYTYPFLRSIGKDISNQPHIKKLMKTCTPILSDPFESVQGFLSVSFQVPVFSNKKFNGSIGVLINLEKIGNVIDSSTQKDEHIFITDSGGTIIASKDADILLKNVYTVIPKTKHADKFVQCEFGEGLLVKKTFNPVPLKTYTVYAFVPKKDVFANVLNKVLYNLILGIIFMISVFYAIRMLYLAYAEESERLKEIAEIKSRESKTLSEKLQTLVSTFAGIDITKGIKEISRELLNAMLKLIPNGNAGSVLIKNGAKFTYTAVAGYPKELEGKFLTDKEIIPSISERAFIIRNIYNVMQETVKGDFKKQTKEILGKFGTKNIKSTLEAPLIVDGKYYGGIFIDNFESENAFTEEDLKIAESVSKIASIVVKVKLLVNSLEETENKLLYAMEEFGKFDISLDEKEFFERILSVGRKLIPQADAGSTTLKRGNFYEYTAIFGYSEVLKKIRYPAGKSYKVHSTEARIVKDIANFNKEVLGNEILETLEKAGASKIKQSIVSPIIVNGKYFGGIYLDSFKDDPDIFTEKDTEVASALSKLASIFVSARIAYQKLKTISSFEKTSLNLFHRAKTRISEEEALKSSYYSLKTIYQEALQEVALWHKKEGKPYIIKFDGERIYRFVASPKSFENAAEKKKSLFISRASEKHPFAQAVIYSGIPSIPVFRVRFAKSKSFTQEEKEFIERFGREAINLYQAAEYHTEFKNMLAKYILSIGNATGAYNQYTEWHSLRVGYLSVHIGKKSD